MNDKLKNFIQISWIGILICSVTLAGAYWYHSTTSGIVNDKFTTCNDSYQSCSSCGINYKKDVKVYGPCYGTSPNHNIKQVPTSLNYHVSFLYCGSDSVYSQRTRHVSKEVYNKIIIGEYYPAE